MQPLFSIITVCYNASTTIIRTMQSVAGQSCCDYEHLIVDGASSDDTLRIVNAMASERTKVLSEPDNGIYDAMNKGINMASGKYLIFLNAGDAFHTVDTLQHIAEAAVKHDFPGVLYGQTDIVDAEGKRIGARHLTAPEHLSYESFAQGMLVCHQAFVVLARIAVPYDLRYRFSADYEWCIRCLQHSRHNQYLPEVLIDYLSEGVTTANRRRSLMERFHIMCHYYGTFPTLVRHLKFLLRFMRYKYSV
ncbi:MAG: glycosyltransferase [Paramuribaculum sp.]|nr:glycosyltransferase [Paramuribaculum sp.]